MSRVMTCPDCGNERWAGIGSCSDCGYEQQEPLEDETIEVVYEIRIKVAGSAPERMQFVNEQQMIHQVMLSSQTADADDDAYVRIVGVEVKRMR